MANIYLRLPSWIAAYHRNYDTEHRLGPFDPVKFSSYTDHAVVMRGGLVLQTNNSRKIVNCYNQTQWKNMLAGKKPDGKQVMKRDADTWLTYDEICALMGVQISHRSDSYDFLCIQMPQTILVGDREVRTNSSFCLTNEAAEVLQLLLARDFKRAFVNWEIETQAHCIQSDRIIQRGQMNTIERFLMHYEIPVSMDGREKESLRRQLLRWLAKAHVLEKAYRTFDIEYEDSEDKVVHLKNKRKLMLMDCVKNVKR